MNKTNPTLRIFDVSQKELRDFHPIDPANVRIYFCGPTAYDRAHIGNLRSMLCADILVRTLRTLFPKVTYVRNVTDIDDKIIDRCKVTGETPPQLAKRMMTAFHEDCGSLNLLPPDIEPNATDHIPQMVEMIQKLIDNKSAYLDGEGQVLFSVKSFPSYGALSGRNIDDLQAGARVEVDSAKHHPADFVLWKPCTKDQFGWDTPFGYGRPGWHIECSAMSRAHLGADFDIHGGGCDLLFPHHENERAQSLGSDPHSHFAHYWIHSGLLRVDGEKMSKSRNNFFTLQQALEHAPGEAIRFLFLMTHYRSPLDFTWEKLAESRKALDKLYRALADHDLDPLSVKEVDTKLVDQEAYAALLNDLNTSQTLMRLHQLATEASKGSKEAAISLLHTGKLLGFFSSSVKDWFQGAIDPELVEYVNKQIQLRAEARKNKDYATSDRIRDELLEKGVVIEDGPSGATWRLQ